MEEEIEMKDHPKRNELCGQVDCFGQRRGDARIVNICMARLIPVWSVIILFNYEITF